MRQWREEIEQLGLSNRLVALTGMRFQKEVEWCNPKMIGDVQRSALSFMPQHHANQCLVDGMILFDSKLDPRDGWVHALVHDNGLAYVKEELAVHYSQILSECLSQAATTLLGDSVVFDADPVITNSWEEKE